MKVVKAFPPNYQAINDAFSVRGKSVIFCYGDRIYNPSGVAVGPDLIARTSRCIRFASRLTPAASKRGGIATSQSRCSGWPRKSPRTKPSFDTGG